MLGVLLILVKSVAQTGDCCTILTCLSSVSTACSNPTVSACVVKAKASCAQTWDASCVNTAITTCGMGSACQACPGDCAGTAYSPVCVAKRYWAYNLCDANCLYSSLPTTSGACSNACTTTGCGCSPSGLECVNAPGDSVTPFTFVGDTASFRCVVTLDPTLGTCSTCNNNPQVFCICPGGVSAGGCRSAQTAAPQIPNTCWATKCYGFASTELSLGACPGPCDTPGQCPSSRQCLPLLMTDGRTIQGANNFRCFNPTCACPPSTSLVCAAIPQCVAGVSGCTTLVYLTFPSLCVLQCAGLMPFLYSTARCANDYRCTLGITSKTTCTGLACTAGTTACQTACLTAGCCWDPTATGTATNPYCYTQGVDTFAISLTLPAGGPLAMPPAAILQGGVFQKSSYIDSQTCGCPSEFAPVCCNGVTFSNACFARCHRQNTRNCPRGECPDPCTATGCQRKDGCVTILTGPSGIKPICPQSPRCAACATAASGNGVCVSGPGFSFTIQSAACATCAGLVSGSIGITTTPGACPSTAVFNAPLGRQGGVKATECRPSLPCHLCIALGCGWNGGVCTQTCLSADGNCAALPPEPDTVSAGFDPCLAGCQTRFIIATCGACVDDASWVGPYGGCEAYVNAPGSLFSSCLSPLPSLAGSPFPASFCPQACGICVQSSIGITPVSAATINTAAETAPRRGPFDCVDDPYWRGPTGMTCASYFMDRPYRAPGTSPTTSSTARDPRATAATLSALCDADGASVACPNACLQCTEKVCLDSVGWRHAVWGTRCKDYAGPLRALCTAHAANTTCPVSCGNCYPPMCSDDSSWTGPTGVKCTGYKQSASNSRYSNCVQDLAWFSCPKSCGYCPVACADDPQAQGALPMSNAVAGVPVGVGSIGWSVCSSFTPGDCQANPYTCLGTCGNCSAVLWCNAVNDVCSTSTDCCTNNCASGSCKCSNAGARCGKSSDCCSGYPCLRNLASGQLQCSPSACLAITTSSPTYRCQRDQDCCNGWCIQGVCT